ncbi:hypothetical protein [Bernardetia sp.]|uniref:hypothetical protein n=1 Tax=Bernardetia sp. TaxID=1937974 RepID=UPI0025C430A4|nr:hypothetical protein [Bernardetia sp.]
MPNYHSHILTSNHSHIIGRTDPITGDTVKENDKVVFCAVCKSCFLEESWIYMGGRHCEQSETLKDIPVVETKLVAGGKKEELVVELRDISPNVISKIINSFSFAFGFLACGALLIKFFLIKSQVFEILLLVISSIAGLIAASISSILTSSRRFKQITKRDMNDIRIFKTHIKVGKKRYSLVDIKQIEYLGRANPSLSFHFANGQYIEYDLFTHSYDLLELEKVSHITRLSLHSDNKDEYEMIQNIQKSSNGDIVIPDYFVFD